MQPLVRALVVREPAGATGQRLAVQLERAVLGPVVAPRLGRVLVPAVRESE